MDKNENIRERLLARLPQPADVAAYRNEVAALLEKKEKALRFEKWNVIPLWIFMAGLSTAFLWLAGQRLDTPKGPYFASLACFSFLFGMVYLVPHFINRGRVELLKEIKQVQLQVLELRAAIAEGGSPKSS
jgi:hypothetical protein